MKKIHGLALFLFMLLSPVFTAHAAGDLSISNENLWFSTDSYLEGNSIRIWASVLNNSSSDLLGSVHFSANGKQIGSDQAISALGGKSDEIFVDWVPSTHGVFTIQVKVNPWDATGDDSSNNLATKQITVVQDSDRDGIANSLDPDDDNDGVLDEEDAFPLNPNESKDSDGDGKGNNEDLDDDNDGTLDVDDQLPEDPKYTKDMDGDGLADEIDTDIDGDDLENLKEEQLGTDPKKADTDGDLKNDGEDAFPLDTKEWFDVDKDGLGDNRDPDIDGDGIPNETDLDPSNPAPIAAVAEEWMLTTLGTELHFDASSSKDDRKIIKYLWNFGEEELEGAVIDHSFKASGLQTATLTVLDEYGQSDTLTVKVHVFNKDFLIGALSFSLFALLLAFYLIYRYNRRASEKKPKK